MRKNLIMILCLILVIFTFGACGGSEQTDNSANSEETTTVEEESKKEEKPTKSDGDYYGEYKTDSGEIEVSESETENSIDATITLSEDGSTISGTFTDDGEGFSNEDLSLTLINDSVIVVGLTEKGAPYSGTYEK